MDTLGPALTDLLDKVDRRLEECDRQAALVTLSPGAEVAWDNCCPDENTEGGGGELWVRVINITPQPVGSQPCDITDLKANIGVGVIRCMHSLNTEGSPTKEQMTDDTLNMTKDADAILAAVRTWEGTKHINMKSLSVERGTPLGPLGGCGGWEWTFTFRYQMCAGCD